MKKLGYLIVLLLLLIFPNSAHAGTVHPFTATKVTFNTSTKVLSFGIKDNPLGYIPTFSSAVAIYDDSGGYYFAYTRPQFQNISSTCNNSHCTIALDQDWNNLQHFTNDTVVNIIIYTRDAQAWWSQGLKLGSILDAIYINQPPVLNSVGNKTVGEGQLLEFPLTATDPDGDNLTYSAANLPTGATFDPQTATFSWIPTFSQEGIYQNIEFTVTDDGNPIELDTELITITVGGVNGAPEFDPISPQEVLENELLTFTVNATDPDGNGITYSATNLPIGASFNPQTRVVSWTPTLSQADNYVVTFNATDDGTPVETGTIDVSITVGDNPTPTEQAENLATTVISYDFPKNVENSYLANLKKVEIFIEEGKIQAAINQLNAFITKVDNDYAAGIITQKERNNLVGLAEALLADLQ